MTREEAKHRLLDIERCTPIHTREDVRDFEALEMAIKALEQKPCEDVICRQAVMDCIDRYSQMIIRPNKLKEYIDRLLPVNPQEPKTEIEELDFVQKHKKIPVTLHITEVQKYCDRNICISNEYNGIGCNECEVTKSQKSKIGHCKDCKWWKDSDGVFRRGIGAESQCPMNRIEVYEGNGYCYMFEPHERSEKE